jgi:hypothetical protein
MYIMSLLRTSVAVALCCARFAAAADPAPPDGPPVNVEILEQKVESMSKELDELRAQLKELRSQIAAPGTPQVQPPSASPQPAQAKATPEAPQPSQATSPSPAQVQPASATTAGMSRWDKLSLWGYGEIYYTHPTTDSAQTQADLARAVFGIGYQFNERTRFNSEFEVEHAVSSADDAGEVEVEQFYVDHDLNNMWSFQAGLFLMPVGLLNEHHEPTNYYGVQRNFVETLIIPTTWREGGVAVKLRTENGLTVSAGITTGLDLSKWDFTPATPPYNNALMMANSGIAPMQATHQELSLANAQKLSGFASLNYTGALGLLVGGSVFSGGVVQAVPNIPNEQATLWELHARWQPGKFDLSALYARGYFTNTAQANMQFPGATNPLPASFYGYYLQAAYLAWQRDEMQLKPFIRWERYNMAASYAGVSWQVPADGFPQSNDYVATLGVSYYLTPDVVFKADYQHFRINSDFTRIDLGMGLSF